MDPASVAPLARPVAITLAVAAIWTATLLVHPQRVEGARGLALAALDARVEVDDRRLVVDELEHVEARPVFGLHPRGALQPAHTRAAVTLAERVALLEAEPERFSPNVVLRPLMQDTLLPTAAYVGGPGEISYFAQINALFPAFGIGAPVVYPRAAFTLVEPAMQRLLDKLAKPFYARTRNSSASL